MLTPKPWTLNLEGRGPAGRTARAYLPARPPRSCHSRWAPHTLDRKPVDSRLLNSKVYIDTLNSALYTLTLYAKR